MILFLIFTLLHISVSYGATIAIIDTGFDLDHDYLRPKILNKETDEEAIDYYGWDFFDNNHMKTPVIEDKSSVQEILLFRNLRAKGHKQGLSLEEFDWFKKKSADKEFMEKVKLFRKHVHGTFVAGIALRQGENINIFPIRGLNIPNPVVAVEDNSTEGSLPLKGKTAEAKFHEEIRHSIDRVSKKFNKICRFVSKKNIEIVNASYGITFKNIMTKFRERYKEMTGKEIGETKLKIVVDDYFRILYERGEKTMKRHPNILFVFSAGNSGLNNDEFHHYPSRIKVPNAITVAAMNGDYLATFSNYGLNRVDVGAPGVAILSLVPKVYSDDGSDLYSPSSGTSMAAPYVSNLAAQIKNTNAKLTPPEIKRIILETGELKSHLKTRLASGAIVNNHKAIRAALLSKDMGLAESIQLGNSDLIQMEDKISIGISPAISPELPSVITPEEVDDLVVTDITRSESSEQKDQEKEQPDNSKQLPLKEKDAPVKSSDQDLSSQSAERFLKPSADLPASSSEPQLKQAPAQNPATSPSSPES